MQAGRWKSPTIRLLAAVCVAAGANAAAKEKPPACAYLEQPLPAPAPAPALERSRLLLQATTPAPGEAVHPDTVIGVDVEYHIADFAPGQYELIVHFARFTVGSSTIVGREEGRRTLSQAHGTVHLCVPVGGLFREENLRWPLQMLVSLQRRTGLQSSTLYADARRVEFPSPDLSAKVLARQQLAPSEDYYLALDEVFAFLETHQAAYRECIAQFPEFLHELDVPHRDWMARNSALIAQAEALELERYTEATRGTTGQPAQKVAEVRADIVEQIAREPELNLRRRCTGLRFVFGGEPREFIGRYLAIVDEQAARRAAGGPPAR
jgi:hypothetical protein